MQRFRDRVGGSSFLLVCALGGTGCSSTPAATPGADAGAVDVAAFTDRGVVQDTGTQPDVTPPMDTGADAAAVPDVPVSPDVPSTVDIPTVPDVPSAVDIPSSPDGPLPPDAGTPIDVVTPVDVAVSRDVPPPPTDVTPTTDVPVTATGTAITMFQVDPQRTGANRTERVLTPGVMMAGRFGRDTAFAPALDGQVYAQPLYLPGVHIAGGVHDVLYVATQANTVFALDAVTSATLWRHTLGTPVARSSQPCGNITPTTGVLGTPVIDAASNTLYAVGYVAGAAGNGFVITALDVTTGTPRAGYPVPLVPPASNGSTFDPRPAGERGALALVNGRIYVPFGGLYGDCGIYHGWVVGLDPRTPATQVSFATPGRGSGIWAVGGASADTAGHLFVATGNSTPLGGFTAGSMGEYVLRLGAGPTGPTASMATTDYFSPSNAAQLDRADLDIGSNGPVVLPDVGGLHLLAQGNKAGVEYLIRADNLGGTGTGDGVTGEGAYSTRLFSGGIYGASGAWSNGTDTWLYVAGRGARAGCAAGGTGGVIALRVTATGGAAAYASSWCSGSAANPNPPAISSNGNTNGIVWSLGAPATGSTAGTFRAYAADSGTPLWSATGTDGPTVRQWVPPVVADGRVYVTGPDTVQMYRLVR